MSVTKIARRLKTHDGYALVIKGEQKTRTIRVFRLRDLKPPSANDPGIDIPPHTFALTLSRAELIRRLNTGKCEYCETTEGPFEVHHMRKMKNVAQGKAPWQKLMVARNRKTLILCLRCHHQLHAGTLHDKDHLKELVKGEPCALKGASTVRERGVRAIPQGTTGPYSTKPGW